MIYHAVDFPSCKRADLGQAHKLSLQGPRRVNRLEPTVSFIKNMGLSLALARVTANTRFMLSCSGSGRTEEAANSAARAVVGARHQPWFCAQSKTNTASTSLLLHCTSDNNGTEEVHKPQEALHESKSTWGISSPHCPCPCTVQTRRR